MLSALADVDALPLVLAVDVQVEAERLRFLADAEVDAVDAAVGLEVERDAAVLRPELPVVGQPPFFLQTERVDALQRPALDLDRSLEAMLLLASGSAQVPAVLIVPQRVAHGLAPVEVPRLPDGVEDRPRPVFLCRRNGTGQENARCQKDCEPPQ